MESISAQFCNMRRQNKQQKTCTILLYKDIDVCLTIDNMKPFCHTLTRVTNFVDNYCFLCK